MKHAAGQPVGQSARVPDTHELTALNQVSRSPWLNMVQRDPGGLAQGFVDLDLGLSPGWWAATVATY